MIISQKPNGALLVAAAGYVVSKLTTGTVRNVGATVFAVAIIIWAYQEVVSGANLFRKMLGAVVLAFAAWSIFALQN